MIFIASNTYLHRKLIIDNWLFHFPNFSLFQYFMWMMVAGGVDFTFQFNWITEERKAWAANHTIDDALKIFGWITIDFRLLWWSFDHMSLNIYFPGIGSLYQWNFCWAEAHIYIYSWLFIFVDFNHSQGIYILCFRRYNFQWS